MKKQNKIAPVMCPSCNVPMVLRNTSKFTYRDGKPRLFYGCSNYPKCEETHGAHPDGRPLGKPAPKRIRDLRHEVHELAATIWPWDDKKARGKMYQWIKRNSRFEHIAEMDMEELYLTKIKLLQMKGIL